MKAMLRVRRKFTLAAAHRDTVRPICQLIRIKLCRLRATVSRVVEEDEEYVW